MLSVQEASVWLEHHHRRVEQMSWERCEFCEKDKKITQRIHSWDGEHKFCSYDCLRYWTYFRLEM